MNIYSVPNRFILTIDSIDYEIREPVGWDSVKAEMSRDFQKYRFGFTDLLVEDDVKVQFTQDPTPNGIRSFDLLRDKFNQDGTDSQALFRLEADFSTPGNPTIWETIYTANIDFDPNKFEIFDREVSATLKTISFEDKFNSRFDTLIDIPGNQDLDGNSSTLYAPTNVKLHSKAIRKVSQGFILFGTSVNARNFEEDLNEIEYENGELGFQPSVNSVVNDPTPPGTDTITLGGNLIAATESRGYSFSITIDSEIFTQDTSAPPVGQIANMYLVDEVNGVITRTLVGTSLAFPPFGQSWFVTQTLNLTKPINEIGNTTYRIEIDVSPTIGGATYLLRVDDFTFTMTQDTLRPESNVNVWTLNQVGRRIIEATTGQDVYQSDILNNGCASGIGLTNGRFIKAQTDAEFNPKTSAKDFINSMGGMFGMGYGFEGTTIRHEPIEHYFQDVEVFQISNTDLKQYSEVPFPDIFFNLCKIGYKEGFDEELFFRDDPQGDHEYLLPLISPKSDFDFRADYIGSMYAIEQKRREQFLREGATNKFDDEIYLIKLDEVTEYQSNDYQYRPNEIQLLEGEFFDVDPGDNITISAGAIAGNYTVGTVTKQQGNTFLQDLTPPIVSNGGFSGPYTLSLNTTKTVPERDENFQSVTNLISPETAYNLKLTPKRLLLNQARWINSILNFKPGTDLIRNQFVKNNGLLTTDLNFVTEACNDPLRLTYQENADIPIEDLNDGAKLFTGRAMKVVAEVGFDNINLIMNANRNLLTGDQESLNRGFITVNTADDTIPFRSGWVYDLRFALNMEIVEMVLLEKA